MRRRTFFSVLIMPLLFFGLLVEVTDRLTGKSAVEITDIRKIP